MKRDNQKRILRLSLVAAMLAGSSVYAGKIITDAGDPADANNTRVDNKQYGFGGWNFDNVDVRVVDVEDFATNIEDFNTTDGSYTGMGVDRSFESDIKDRSAGTVMGHLHGKDWPVGEPAGIKIINGDNAVEHGKPENCIMTSSYLSGGYLDDATPSPVICSSDFQTHKRFKINMLPTSVGEEGEYGNPIDLVFNLDPADTTTVRYQVLQKINNYTNMRLDGYKVEVLDENGSVNPALTLSLGLGEGTDSKGISDGSNIWDAEDMANMSHGLWGPVDSHFTQQGFFDDVRAYYPVTLSAPNTISYIGEMAGGNYQALFGNWLPSSKMPKGIFHDDDGDPETDGILMAFYGDPFATGTDDWHKGEADNWAIATDAERATWTGTAYEEEGIEDVLNLGLNYIINIGDNSAIGSTFILRITPHVDADQTSNPVGIIPAAAPSPDDTVDDVADTPVDIEGNTASSGGGGGCSYNKNSKSFDMMFLILLGLGLLYPIRKKLLRR
ncbi:hypothetical protein MNB_SV-5-165 [hydrothermal vent metagenome]|uniref:Uncharacterized protein n=1 Tax=hydrothermal vent metagenome TaxID=652676 RepID=A0A1W1ECP2_9ZZZZ